MSDEQRVAVGLAIVAQREEEMFFDILKAQIVDWRMAEALLARAERLEDAIRLGGVPGFERAIVADVRLVGARTGPAVRQPDEQALRRAAADRVCARAGHAPVGRSGHPAHRVVAPAPPGPDRKRHAGVEPAVPLVRTVAAGKLPGPRGARTRAHPLPRHA
ncbi:hypothetical protein G6F22_017963 [Rhizopus arrhizus]|nr:hypothetical protein G6F22_017963 [Rhizopus arrhizus]